MQNIDTPPLVSIFCITYNHSSYIRQCLDGFLIQKTNFPFEVLIHDDASTDDTAGIIKEYEAKYPDIIKPIYQVENQYSKGLDINIVYNLPRARGKYILMLKYIVKIGKYSCNILGEIKKDPLMICYFLKLKFLL